MTDLQQSANLLTRLNRWRTGGHGEMPDPSEITAAINTAIASVRNRSGGMEGRDMTDINKLAERLRERVR